MLAVVPPTSSSSSFLRPFPQVKFSAGRPPGSRHGRRLDSVLQSIGDGRWKLTDIDPDVVRESFSLWLGKAQSLLTEVATPLVNPGQGRKPALERQLDKMAVQEEIFMASELTLERRTPKGYLSFAAVVSIEQFGRMNGLTGRKMQKIFEALAPQHV